MKKFGADEKPETTLEKVLDVLSYAADKVDQNTDALSKKFDEFKLPKDKVKSDLESIGLSLRNISFSLDPPKSPLTQQELSAEVYHHKYGQISIKIGKVTDVLKPGVLHTIIQTIKAVHEITRAKLTDVNEEYGRQLRTIGVTSIDPGYATKLQLQVVLVLTTSKGSKPITLGTKTIPLGDILDLISEDAYNKLLKQINSSQLSKQDVTKEFEDLIPDSSELKPLDVSSIDMYLDADSDKNVYLVSGANKYWLANLNDLKIYSDKTLHNIEKAIIKFADTVHVDPELLTYTFSAVNYGNLVLDVFLNFEINKLKKDTDLVLETKDIGRPVALGSFRYIVKKSLREKLENLIRALLDRDLGKAIDIVGGKPNVTKRNLYFDFSEGYLFVNYADNSLEYGSINIGPVVDYFTTEGHKLLASLLLNASNEVGLHLSFSSNTEHQSLMKNGFILIYVEAYLASLPNLGVSEDKEWDIENSPSYREQHPERTFNPNYDVIPEKSPYYGKSPTYSVFFVEISKGKEHLVHIYHIQKLGPGQVKQFQLANQLVDTSTIPDNGTKQSVYANNAPLISYLNIEKIKNAVEAKGKKLVNVKYRRNLSKD